MDFTPQITLNLSKQNIILAFKPWYKYNFKIHQKKYK